MKDKNKTKRHVISLLIVDDDPFMTETLEDIFSNLGYCTDTAPDGFQAIEMVKQKIYDSVLLDIMMPGMNGVETFRELKRIRSSTTVIMMTAYSVEKLVGEALDEGATAVVYKPLDIRKLKQLIDNMHE